MTDLFDALQALRETRAPFGPAVDGVALRIAQGLCDELSDKLDISLTRRQWSRATAILQVRLAAVLRHAAFDRPDFPSDRFEEGTGWR